MDKKLEKYITEISSSEDPVLEELFRESHIRFVNPNMVSGHLQGMLLTMISGMIRPAKVLEIGTFTGYSAICLAKGIMPGGKLITIEQNEELADFSRNYFIKAGLSSVIQLVNGRAQDIIPDINEVFDLAYIDGDKREYCEYFGLVFEKVRQGGYIMADNVLWGGKVLDNTTKDPQTKGVTEFNEMVRNYPATEKIIIPFRDGLMLVRKT